MKLIVIIRSIVSKIPFAKTIYKKLHVDERIRLYRERKQMKIFAEKGDSVIKDVHKVLNQSGCLFFIDAGTLIGVYRDGRLLKRDMDVDMAVKVDGQEEIMKVRQLLKDNGFVLKIIFSTNSNGIIQDAYDYDGVRVDVSFLKNSGSQDYCHILYDDNKIARMTFSSIKAIKHYDYNGQTVNIPIDADKYLEERYGKTWRIPDPYFKYWEAPCVTKEDGTGICEFTN